VIQGLEKYVRAAPIKIDNPNTRDDHTIFLLYLSESDMKNEITMKRTPIGTDIRIDLKASCVYPSIQISTKCVKIPNTSGMNANGEIFSNDFD
jgi:hypothetical protein